VFLKLIASCKHERLQSFQNFLEDRPESSYSCRGVIYINGVACFNVTFCECSSYRVVISMKLKQYQPLLKTFIVHKPVYYFIF
jgi:hypothetical protein